MKLFKTFVAFVLFGLGAMAQPALAQKYVCMQSTKGEWCMRMLPEVAPGTVANFLAYVNSGAYTNNMVHRSVPGFVIQGGGFNLDLRFQPDPVTSRGKIANEFNRSNLRGTVAMAKAAGDVNSATSQWFINLADNTRLDLPALGSFTVFAEVVYGMPVVDRIASFRVADFRFYWGDVFSEVPVDAPLTAPDVGYEDFVLITNAYTTDLLPGSTVLPYHCTPNVPDVALTELCGNSLNFPVSVQGLGYEVTLDLVASQPQFVLEVRPGSIKHSVSLGTVFATYTASTGEVVIPSVRVGGRIYQDVKMMLTNVAAQQFTIVSFKDQ